MTMCLQAVILVHGGTDQATRGSGDTSHRHTSVEKVLMHQQQLEERQRLALARIEDATYRLAALAHRRYIVRETIEENDTQLLRLRETEITADALNLIVLLLTPQPQSEF